MYELTHAFFFLNAVEVIFEYSTVSLFSCCRLFFIYNGSQNQISNSKQPPLLFREDERKIDLFTSCLAANQFFFRNFKFLQVRMPLQKATMLNYTFRPKWRHPRSTCTILQDSKRWIPNISQLQQQCPIWLHLRRPHQHSRSVTRRFSKAILQDAG